MASSLPSGLETTAPGLEGRKTRQHRRRRATTILMFAVIALVFGAKVANYAFPETIRFNSLWAHASRGVAGMKSLYDNVPNFHSAPPGEQMVSVPGGFVFATGPDDNVYAHIFETYPMFGGAKTAVYPSITHGSMSVANDLLRNRVDIPRYAPVSVTSETPLFELDPYKARYWRFYYYSLRPTISLVDAYLATGKKTYISKLLQIDNSFFAVEDTSRLVWADKHAVAFRVMVLTYQWWTLRAHHVLSLAESTLLLRSIEKNAAFLADPNNYEPGCNHGTNEAAGLLLVGAAFPSLPSARAWLATARDRLSANIGSMIDEDGVLIENSPYYHFYDLDKLWQIYDFAKVLNVEISPTFHDRLLQMVNYATYVLQPNDAVPMLGASLAQTIHDHGSFKAMSAIDPQFKYVLTQGASGTVPRHTSINFPHAGQTFFRSGWGKGTEFKNASYLTFNVGAYRTKHSALDLLGVNLYDNGMTLISPPGLYTYVPGPMHDYFHGTASHNAVVVDGESQTEGTAYAGPLVQKNGLTYQSGETDAYDGVTDRRTVVMVDKDHFVVLDRLTSASAHTYQQMWHLFPGAKVSQNGLSVTGAGPTPDQTVTISQLAPAGIGLTSVIGRRDPPAGLNSAQYQVAVPCQQIAYTQRGKDAAYTTLLSVGNADPGFSATFSASTGTLRIRSQGRHIVLALGTSVGRTMSVSATDVTPPPLHSSAIAGTLPLANWSGSIPGAVSIVTAGDDIGRRVLKLTSGSGVVSASNNRVTADLSRGNLLVRMKAVGTARIAAFQLELTSDHWRSHSSFNLNDIYRKYYEGEWLTLSVGRDSTVSRSRGHWESSQGPLNWRRIDGARLVLDGTPGGGPQPTLYVEWLRTTPQPKSGVVSFVFDDGYESILPAADYLHQLGMPANVAVIGKYTELPSHGHLNVFQLRRLQNVYGWNMANHTQRHEDALAYYKAGHLGAYEQDILDGAVWLERAGLNSAPNWLIYPHGTTNAVLARIVSRFYKFARTTDIGTEAYPFGTPLRVKTLEIQSAGSTDDFSGGALTSPSTVAAAVHDAKKYHTTLILTFHRIKATPSDLPGYPISLFRQVADVVHASGLPVLTLSQLDRANGVPEDNRITVTPGVPSLITIRASVSDPPPKSLWSRLTGAF